MYQGLLHLHSFIAYILLVVVSATVVKYLVGTLTKKNFTAIDDKLSLVSLISVHLQLVVGTLLFFTSPLISGAMADIGAAMKDSAIRFYFIEHWLMMVIGGTLITIGRVKIKKIERSSKKFKTGLIFFALGLVLILSRVPWDRL